MQELLQLALALTNGQRDLTVDEVVVEVDPGGVLAARRRPEIGASCPAA